MKRVRGAACRTVLLFGLLGSLALPQIGRAAEQRILVLEQGDALARALRVALASWGSEVRVTDGTAAAAIHDAPGAARLVRAHGAAALIWIDRAGGRVRLNVYVAEHGEVTSQVLREPPPFHEEAAAAVALSVKTVLRNSALAPAAERTPPAASAPSTPAASGLPLARFELAAGVRSRPSANTHVRARYGASLALFEPWWSRRRLGLSLEAMLSQHADFETAGARGSLSEFWIAVGARGLLPLARFLDLELAAGYDLERTRIAGHDSLQRSFSAARINSGLSFAVALDFRVARRVFVAPRFGVHRILRPQRYWIGEELVLELARVALEGTLRVGVALL